MYKIVYGLNTIESILDNKSNIIIESYYINCKKINTRVCNILNKLKKNKILIKTVSKTEINKIFNIKNNQNIFIKIKDNFNINLNKFKKINLINKKIILILENIKDPRNLGACLRCADAANVDCVIITKNKSCPVNETVRKVASGAVDNLSIYIINNILNIIKILKEKNIKIIGTSDKSDILLYKFKFKFPIAIIFGSEDKGIKLLTKKYCDTLLKIPTLGKTYSLNVSVATGIFLFEIIRQNFYK